MTQEELRAKYPDQMVNEYNLGVQKGLKHAGPSEQTIINFKKMDDKIEKILNKLTGLEVSIAGLPEKIYEKADRKYANIKIESDVEVLCGKIEKMTNKESDKNYDWVKYFVTTIFSVLITIGLTLALKK